MPTSQVAPLSYNVPIVDPKTGNPTPYFQELIQQWLVEKGITDGQAQGAVQSTRAVNTDATLTGGGALSADLTLGVNTTAEAERIRDVIGTALVAGTNITITVNDAGDTITIAASGGGGTSWSLAATNTVSSAVASVSFTGLAGENDIMVIGRNITTSASSFPVIQVSTNNGSSWFTTSGDYVRTADAGIETNLTTGPTFWGTAATAARTGAIIISGANVTGTPRLMWNPNDGASLPRFFLGDTANDIDAVRIVTDTGANLTGGTFYCLKR
jgi:hypothetical protein